MTDQLVRDTADSEMDPKDWGWCTVLGQGHCPLEQKSADGKWRVGASVRFCA